MNNDGLITVQSKNSFAGTLNRLKSAIQSAGMTVFAVFDHAAGAGEVGLSLRPTTVIAFGSPAAGTKLMQANQIAGIDLPLKILAWEGEDGITKLTYNDPHWLAERHSLGAEVTPQIAGMTKLLASITESAASETAQRAEV
ncbi:MAG: DUF302 domain-containing protein [Terriglobales bacterium]